MFPCEKGPAWSGAYYTSIGKRGFLETGQFHAIDQRGHGGTTHVCKRQRDLLRRHATASGTEEATAEQTTHQWKPTEQPALTRKQPASNRQASQQAAFATEQNADDRQTAQQATLATEQTADDWQSPGPALPAKQSAYDGQADQQAIFAKQKRTDYWQAGQKATIAKKTTNKGKAAIRTGKAAKHGQISQQRGYQTVSAEKRPENAVFSTQQLGRSRATEQKPTDEGYRKYTFHFTFLHESY